MIIPFIDWKPDAADFGAKGSTTIKNCVPAERSFQPFPSLTTFTDALTARPRGGIEAFDKDETSHTYLGDATKLYELDESDLTWTDVTNTGGAYTTATGEVWRFARWKNKILCTNFSDNPQQITMGGANFSDLTSAFRARDIAVVRDFVVFGNTYDSTDGNVPNRVRWSGIDDETTYTVSASTLSDFRDIPVGGPIKKIVGGEVGIIVSERSIFRLSYVGAPVVFQIDEILPDVGTISGGSVVGLGDSVFMISDQGIIEVTGNGTGINPIGAGRVDRWFFENYDADYPERIFSIADPTRNRVFWCFPGPGNNAGTPNLILLFDRTFNKWSLIEDEVELLLRAKGFEVTLDNLPNLGFDNIDEMEASLDSNQFKIRAEFGAVDETNKFGFFTGENMTAVLETGEVELSPGYKTMLKGVRPMVDGGTVTAEIGHRSRLVDPVVFEPSVNQSSTGRFTTRVNDNFHRIRLTVSGDWSDAIGVDIPRDDAIRAGRRG